MRLAWAVGMITFDIALVIAFLWFFSQGIKQDIEGIVGREDGEARRSSAP